MSSQEEFMGKKDLTRAQSIYQGLGYLLEIAEKHDLGVDTCAEHDMFHARLEIHYGFGGPGEEEWEAAIDARMKELGWDKFEGESLAYQRYT